MEKNTLVALVTFQSIPFGADGSCSSTFICPTLDIIKGACSRRPEQDEPGFSMWHGHCKCYKQTHSEGLKSCTSH